MSCSGAASVFAQASRGARGVSGSEALQRQSYEEIRRLTLLGGLGVLDTDPEPGFDGMAALAELRRDERTAGIPVIALSGNALPGQVSAAIAAGCEAYWTKPINIEGVFAALALRLPTPAPDSTAAASAQSLLPPRKPS